MQESISKVKKDVDSERERETRSHNVILYKVSEVADREQRIKNDKEFCLEMFRDVLQVDVTQNDFKAIFRLGKLPKESGGAASNDGSTEKLPRPLMVQFREKSVKNQVMESLYHLRDAEDKFKRVNVSHDLSKDDRNAIKQLVAEAKSKQDEEEGEFLWRVRGIPGQMKVIKIRRST